MRRSKGVERLRLPNRLFAYYVRLVIGNGHDSCNYTKRSNISSGTTNNC